MKFELLRYVIEETNFSPQDFTEKSKIRMEKLLKFKARELKAGMESDGKNLELLMSHYFVLKFIVQDANLANLISGDFSGREYYKGISLDVKSLIVKEFELELLLSVKGLFKMRNFPLLLAILKENMLGKAAVLEDFNTYVLAYLKTVLLALKKNPKAYKDYQELFNRHFYQILSFGSSDALDAVVVEIYRTIVGAFKQMDNYADYTDLKNAIKVYDFDNPDISNVFNKPSKKVETRTSSFGFGTLLFSLIIVVVVVTALLINPIRYTPDNNSNEHVDAYQSEMVKGLQKRDSEILNSLLGGWYDTLDLNNLALKTGDKLYDSWSRTAAGIDGMETIMFSNYTDYDLVLIQYLKSNNLSMLTEATFVAAKEELPLLKSGGNGGYSYRIYIGKKFAKIQDLETDWVNLINIPKFQEPYTYAPSILQYQFGFLDGVILSREEDALLLESLKNEFQVYDSWSSTVHFSTKSTLLEAL